MSVTFSLTRLLIFSLQPPTNEKSEDIRLEETNLHQDDKTVGGDQETVANDSETVTNSDETVSASVDSKKPAAETTKMKPSSLIAGMMTQKEMQTVLQQRLMSSPANVQQLLQHQQRLLLQHQVRSRNRLSASCSCFVLEIHITRSVLGLSKKFQLTTGTHFAFY